MVNGPKYEIPRTSYGSQPFISGSNQWSLGAESQSRQSRPKGLHPGCKKTDCLFQREHGCKNCKYCVYCGGRLYLTGSRKNIHHDHIKPDISNGRTTAPSCSNCNTKKGKKGLKSWLRHLDSSSDKTDKNLLNKIFRYNLHRDNKVAKAVRDIRQDLQK